MVKQLRDKPTLPLKYLNQRVEQPQLKFPRYGIAFHYVVSDEKARIETLPPADEPFRSYEDDVLAYAYRDSIPFSTSVRRVPPELQKATLSFASELCYCSEGQAVWLVPSEEPAPTHIVDVHACVTTFKSGICVNHLVFSSQDPEQYGRDPLNEYEIIKLIKLWEDGEDVRGNLPGEGAESCVSVTAPGAGAGADTKAASYTVSELAAKLFPLAPREKHDPPVSVKLKAGTVELEGEKFDPQMWQAAGGVAHWAKAKENKAAWNSRSNETGCPDDPTRLAVQSLAGIVQGLVDFEEIGADELTDVFIGVPVADEALAGLHKGTLVTVEHEDRDEEAGRPAYFVSPYHFLPQSVLLHNEALVDRANEAWKPAQMSNSTHELTEASRSVHRELDADILPNVFHYDNEKNFYVTGHESRGIDERANQFRRRLVDLDARYDFLISRRRDRGDDIRNMLLFVISIIGVGAIWKALPVFAVVIILVVGVGGYVAFLWGPGESNRWLADSGRWLFRRRKATPR
jgi:hypothetical protein